MLTNVDIEAAFTTAMAARSERTALDQDWVIERLRNVVDWAMAAVPVRDAKGKETGVFTFNGATANRALELLGRHLGMFTEKHEHSGTIVTKIELVIIKP